VTFAGALPSADLGGSSDYSSGMLEGLSGEGFREQVNLPRLSRRLKAQEKPLVGKIRGCHCPARGRYNSGDCFKAKEVAIPLPKCLEVFNSGFLDTDHVYSGYVELQPASESSLLFFTRGRSLSNVKLLRPCLFGRLGCPVW